MRDRARDRERVEGTAADAPGRRFDRIRPAAVAAALCLLAAPALAGSLRAQEEEPAGGGAVPEGWEVRTDRGGVSEGAPEGLSFETMEPGWHVTTGPALILWEPSRTASGRYRAESEIHLFDPGERREGFGLFVGGRELRGEGQAYTYFLLRRDGRYLVKERRGSETRVLRDWTEHPAIVSWDERSEGASSVRNVLTVESRGDDVAFLVNGVEVGTLPTDGLSLDGVVGLRVNHGLDLHVSRLSVGPPDGG